MLLRGHTPFMLFSEITFQKCHRQDRGDNQSQESKPHNCTQAFSEVCWLRLFAGLVNQLQAVREFNGQLQPDGAAAAQIYSLLRPVFGSARPKTR